MTAEQAGMETAAAGKIQLGSVYHYCEYLEPENVLTEFHWNIYSLGFTTANIWFR